MPNAFDVLKERGFVYDVSDEGGLRQALEQPITLYDGFDPSGASLTAGHLLGIMMLAWLQRLGHRPIAIMGGGTALIGDPSGKTSIRRVLSEDEIERNLAAMQRQMARFLEFGGDKALMINNATWLTSLNYIDFLRDIGRHFSVNHMLGAEVYKARLESGLSFLEMNYQVLQAYDFLHLFRHHGCVLQVGGSDQWSNILAGVDLIRRVEGKTAYALVTPLLTTASGQKMGKTEVGAIWLDPELTSPYELYQYFINTEDPDVEKYLALLTFLPMDQVRELGRLRDADIRQAKEVLAVEVTSIVHGKEEARKARDASRALFSGRVGLASGQATGVSNGTARATVTPASLPAFEVARDQLRAGFAVHELFADAFGKSRREARQTVEAGGCYFEDQPVQLGQRIDREGLLRWGQKNYRRLLARS